jgi:hypothetical protein
MSGIMVNIGLNSIPIIWFNDLIFGTILNIALKTILIMWIICNLLLPQNTTRLQLIFGYICNLTATYIVTRQLKQ